MEAFADLFFALFARNDSGSAKASIPAMTVLKALARDHMIARKTHLGLVAICRADHDGRYGLTGIGKSHQCDIGSRAILQCG